MSQYLNLEYMFIDGVGQYDIPEILPTYSRPDVDNWIEFDYAKRTTRNRSKTGIHFFEYECKFVRCWEQPTKYMNLLSQFGLIISPDFSMYTDFPRAIQIYNKYRNHWLARYWQEQGLIVIPNIGWSTEDNWDWQFEGYPKHSIVAVSNIGCMREKVPKQIFLKGYQEMLKRLEPTEILFLTKKFDHYDGNVTYIRHTMMKEDQR